MRAVFCILSLFVLLVLGSARSATDSVGDLATDAVQCIGAPIGNLRSVITFAFAQGTAGAGTTDPILGLNPAQSCEIPSQLIVGQQRGTVGVKLRILSNGTVADVQVAAPSRSNLLNDAAIRLAPRVLMFSPATNKGIPTDVERLINVTFNVQVDELWYVKPSLQNPAPSEQLAFGLDRLRWGMSPAEVKVILPTLGPVPARKGFLMANQSRLFVEDYQYAGCRFELMLWFAAEHLTSVGFSNSDGCVLAADVKNRIESELQARYGTGALPQWRGFVTAGSYTSNTGAGISVEFQAVNAPRIMVI